MALSQCRIYKKPKYYKEDTISSKSNIEYEVSPFYSNISQGIELLPKVSSSPQKVACYPNQLQHSKTQSILNNISISANCIQGQDNSNNDNTLNLNGKKINIDLDSMLNDLNTLLKQINE